MNKNRNYILKFTNISVLILLMFFPLIYNIFRLNNFCIHTQDFGIYQEAIYRLSNGFKDLNPYILVRNIHIFADHFDPIILLPALIINIFGESGQSLLIFEWFIYILTGLFLYRYLLKNKIKHPVFWMYLYLFSRGILQAINYPIHPLTWSILPVMFLIFNFESQSSYQFIIEILLLNFICLFKEIFPILFICYSFFYFYNKDYKKFAFLFINFALWIIFDFIIRPKLMGAIVNYANQSDSSISLIKLISRIDYLELLKVISPIGLFSIYLCFKKIKNQIYKDHLIRLILILLPYLGIQFIVRDNISFHYASFVSILLFTFSIVIMNNSFSEISLKMRCTFLFISFLICMGNYTKYIKVFSNHEKSCSIHHHFSSPLKEISVDKKNPTILASGAIAPHLISKMTSVYQYKAFSTILDSYDYMAFNRYGDFHPSLKEEHERIISNCKKEASLILIDNEEAYIARGPFKKDCLFQKGF
jgi:hypothetical protein